MPCSVQAIPQTPIAVSNSANSVMVHRILCPAEATGPQPRPRTTTSASQLALRHTDDPTDQGRAPAEKPWQACRCRDYKFASARESGGGSHGGLADRSVFPAALEP